METKGQPMSHRESAEHYAAMVEQRMWMHEPGYGYSELCFYEMVAAALDEAAKKDENSCLTDDIKVYNLPTT